MWRIGYEICRAVSRTSTFQYASASKINMMLPSTCTIIDAGSLSYRFLSYRTSWVEKGLWRREWSVMDNPATDIPTLTLRTTTWATPRQNEQCLHRLPTCCMTAGPDGDESKCCACLDDRPHGLLYDEGPNGIVVEDGLFLRWDRYCAYCRSKYSFIYMCSYQGLAPRGTPLLSYFS